ncbi:MAG: murein biosynthesis integral membrane protein MurJ [Phototrophicales bacterium]|nr:MAG: murein biosynthesis integral membrane protein MurJ [Phototrophicales bacterium]
MLNNSQIFRAALIVLLGFLASGVLGFVRTGAFSATFGASAELDAFYAAQRIPELLFTLVAGGALGSSFIPVFTRYLNKHDMDHAWKLASATMTLSAAAAGILALILAILAPILVPVLLVPGKPADQQALTTSLTQMMLITTVIFSISGLTMGILNAHQNFTYPALAASMYNLGMIIGALVIAPNLAPAANQTGDANVYGLAVGAILGAILHFMVQVPGLVHVRARLRWLFNWRVEGVREVLTLMAPRVLGLAVVQINFLVNVAFASTMVEGSQTALSTAWFLLFFVLGVIAQSVGTAIFPTLSALVAANDIENYRARLSTAMRSVLFLAFPATVGLILLGEPVVSIFERGEWGEQSTQATAWALGFFALGIAGHSLLEVLSRAFYALADTWTPVKVGVAAMLGNILLSVILIQIIGQPDSLVRGPFAGLALANSLATLIESAILWWLLTRRVNGIHDQYILQGAGRALAAALLMGGVVWLITLIELPKLVHLILGTSAGVITFFGLAIMMRLDEVAIITRRVFRRS